MIYYYIVNHFFILDDKRVAVATFGVFGLQQDCDSTRNGELNLCNTYFFLCYRIDMINLHPLCG